MIIWLKIGASKGIISTAHPVFHMSRLICWRWAYVFTHSEVILCKKSTCFIISIAQISPGALTLLTFHMFSLHAPNGIDGLFKIVPFSRYFHCTLLLSVWTFHLLILSCRLLHSFVLAYISLCLFKLVNINPSLPGSLWAALQSSPGFCYFLCMFIGTFIQPLPQKPWNHTEHRGFLCAQTSCPLQERPH